MKTISQNSGLHKKTINNLDIIYLIFTLLVTAILATFNYKLALNIGGIVAILGTYFMPYLIGAKILGLSGDERAKTISEKASSFAFNIVLLFAILMNMYFKNAHRSMVPEILDVIIMLGYFFQNIFMAVYRRVY